MARAASSVFVYLASTAAYKTNEPRSVHSNIATQCEQLCYPAQTSGEKTKGEVVCVECSIIWSKTWTLRRSKEKRIEPFEMWIWRRMERVNWTDRIRNEAMLGRVGEERMTLKLIRKRKRNWLGHWIRINSLLKDPLEGMVNGRRVRVRRRYQMIDDMNNNRNCA
ncbi:hypothetical protein ANN_25026 [Periplaneta americana]|uniref:Uncharacterized protein n=1 Tax=Periplaneta americana TaxID=6978 RepID=A0ABQ8S097_PERAM|nr:hypothetical protein ANN_25026 [Periplaneta americana]